MNRVVRLFRRLSIRDQLIIGMVAVYVLTITLLMVNLVARQHAFLYEHSAEQTRSLAETLAVSSTSWMMANDLVGMAEVVASVARTPGVRYVMLLAPDGQVLAHSTSDLVGKYVSDAISLALLAQQHESTLIDNAGLADVAHPVMVDSRLLGWARVGMGREEIARNLAEVKRLGVLFALGGILAGSLMIGLVATWLTRGLKELDRAFARIGDDQRDFRLTVGSGDEVGRLRKAFNRMMETLESNEEARLRAAEELEASEERWRYALEGAGDAVFDLDVPSGKVTYSRRWKEMLGYAEDEIENTFDGWRALTHSDDAAKTEADLQAYFAGRTSEFSSEFRMRCRDGSWRWILGRGKVVSRDAAGRPLRLIGTNTDISERKRLEAELSARATTDDLTGLNNRRFFIARLAEEHARLRRNAGATAAVLMCDLDHFKDVNDHYGHAVGDRVLRLFARHMRAELRAMDSCGRIGGEEFAALLPDADADEAGRIAERLRARVESSPLRDDELSVRFTVSIGISSMSGDDDTPDQALIRADKALYRAKSSGRNRVVFGARQ